MKIGVLDYGAGNLKNVCRALDYLKKSYYLISTADDFHDASKIIIPGVGAFKVAMEQIIEKDLIDGLNIAVNSKIPILGICLGMQLLFERSSEFGNTNGLAFIKGEIKPIPTIGLSGKKLKVPHIGWNELVLKLESSPIVAGVVTGDPVYYVHSYKAVGVNPNDIVCSSIYDGIEIPGIVQNDNVYGCQFHPEKSGDLGLRILNNFLEQ